VEAEAVLHHDDEADAEDAVVRHNNAVCMHVVVEVEVDARSAGNNKPVQLHSSVGAEDVLHHAEADGDAVFVRHNAVAMMMNMNVYVDAYTVQLHPPLDRR
jgi:hypothetical protein